MNLHEVDEQYRERRKGVNTINRTAKCRTPLERETQADADNIGECRCVLGEMKHQPMPTALLYVVLNRREKMKKSELVQELRCELFGYADTLEAAGQYMQDVIQALPKDYQGDLWVALGVSMNTIANEIEKLDD